MVETRGSEVQPEEALPVMFSVFQPTFLWEAQDNFKDAQ